MTFRATDLDCVLLALVATGGVAIDVADVEGVTPYPRPACGGQFAPALQERLTLLVEAGLVRPTMVRRS